VANEEQLEIARNFYPELGDGLDIDSPSEMSRALRATATRPV
jgi:hypothetical protein